MDSNFEQIELLLIKQLILIKIEIFIPTCLLGLGIKLEHFKVYKCIYLYYYRVSRLLDECFGFFWVFKKDYKWNFLTLVSGKKNDVNKTKIGVLLPKLNVSFEKKEES